MMREILSFIFGKLTDPLGLPLVWYKEWLILAAIGFIAYIIAFKFVGDLYRFDLIDGRTSGSILHWVIRFVFFVIIWAITYAVIWFVRFVKAHWIIVISVGCGLLLLAIICLTVYFIKERVENE